MRIPLALLMAVVALQSAAAQPAEHDFDEYLARIAEGDIPIVDAGEPETGWNVAEYLRFDHDGTESRFPLSTDQGEIIDASCQCGNVSVEENALVVGADAAAGTHVVRLVRNLPASDAVLIEFALHGGQEGRVVAYVPDGHHVDTSAQQQSGGLRCTDGTCTIAEYAAAPGMHFAILPGDASGAVAPDPGQPFAWMPAIIGLVAGMILWSILVQRGLVQRRRRQEVAQAAHVTAAGEGKQMLQARKRVLMAGLKDLEVAKMNKQVDDDAYVKLKAELKRETVTVMRALEQEG